MVPESYFLLVVTFISLLVISAFFSSAEVAFLSLSEVDLKELRKKATKRSKRTVQLWDNHHTFFISYFKSTSDRDKKAISALEKKDERKRREIKITTSKKYDSGIKLVYSPP